MRVYVACAYSEIATARSVAADLVVRFGFEIVSTWHALSEKKEARLSAKDREGLWEQNAQDMEKCQAMFVPCLVGNPRTTFAEIGHVLALGEHVVICDPRDHREMPLVCYAPRVIRCHERQQGIAALLSLREGLR